MPGGKRELVGSPSWGHESGTTEGKEESLCRKEVTDRQSRPHRGQRSLVSGGGGAAWARWSFLLSTFLFFPTRGSHGALDHGVVGEPRRWQTPC